MIKLCAVLTFNKITHIVVANYGGVQIQFVTNKDSLGANVYIKKNGSEYEIVDKSEYEKSLKVEKKTNIKKENVSTEDNFKDSGLK